MSTMSFERRTAMAYDDASRQRLARLLRYIIEYRGMTVTEVAHREGAAVATIHRILAAENRRTSLTTLHKLDAQLELPRGVLQAVLIGDIAWLREASWREDEGELRDLIVHELSGSVTNRKRRARQG